MILRIFVIISALIANWYLLYLPNYAPVMADCPIIIENVPTVNGSSTTGGPVVIETGSVVTISLPPGSSVPGKKYWIYVNLQFSPADGSASSLAGPFEMTIQADGSSSVSFTLSIPTNGIYPITILGEFPPTSTSTSCSVPIQIDVQGGDDPVPVPVDPNPDCLRPGSSCVPGVSDDQICNIELNWCKPTSSGGVVIARNWNSLGGGCRRGISSETGQPEWSCNNDVGLIPSEQGPECVCYGRHPAICDVPDTGEIGIKSPAGCIPIEDVNNTMGTILRLGLSIIGGIALLMTIFSTYTVMTSKGDPRKLQGGKQTITAALSAVLFLIFSIFIFRFIGTQLLGIF